MTTAKAGPAGEGADVAVKIQGLRSAKGDVLLCLTANPKFFPDCGKDKSARKIQLSATQASAAVFSNVSPGTYAIAAIHDENANGKMDLRLFLPREGFGFSKNPKIGMGAPKFTSAQFVMGSSNVSQSITMKYML